MGVTTISHENKDGMTFDDLRAFVAETNARIGTGDEMSAVVKARVTVGGKLQRLSVTVDNP